MKYTDCIAVEITNKVMDDLNDYTGYNLNDDLTLIIIKL